MTSSTHSQSPQPLLEPFSTGASWLMRALAVSAVLHMVVVIVWWLAIHPSKEQTVETVDIEVAPPPPKAEALPAEVAKPPEASSPDNAATMPPEPAPPEHSDELAMVDAGVPDAPVDAPPKKKKHRPDASIEDMNVADLGDAGLDADAGEAVAIAPPMATDPGFVPHDGGPDMLGSGAGSGIAALQQGSGLGSGVAAATEQGSGSGVAGMDNQPAVEGAPTSAGTAANLLAYFPAGHQISVLIRFDRLRGTEWAEPAEKLFQPMPDYRALFGTRTAAIGDKLETLVISTPRPRDATATTLVVHSALSRPELRTFLTNTDTPIAWSSTKGGLFGKRSGKLFPNDKRVLLSPWKNWVVLAQPEDLDGVTTPATGSLDTIEAKAKLPAWLAGIRKIETESGDEKRGPALVLTLTGPGKRYKFPDVVGLGVTSAPSPTRLSLAMELVKQGWLVRGNIVFANEADATEFVQTATDMQQRITDSRVLSGVLKRQHALNVVTGLSLARTGARVSYATSLSIADARAVLAVMAATLDDYFNGQQP